jgi:hypothetical protein
MINLEDNQARKHLHCQDITLKWWGSRLRCYCSTHQKWLHTLSESETTWMMNNYPYDVEPEIPSQDKIRRIRDEVRQRQAALST